jgi:flagella basal body P-ring formation protein FlgA
MNATFTADGASIQRGTVALLLMLAAMTAHADSDAPWLQVAQEALRARLQLERPDIPTWVLEPRIGARQLQRLPQTTPARVQVTRVAARSAVNIFWEFPSRATATVWFAARGLRPVVTARQATSVGGALQIDEAAVQEVDILPLSCNPLVSLDALQGMRTKVALRSGDVICKERIEPQPAVARGDEVVVVSTAGAVSVTARALAQSDGEIGERLKVRNARSRDVYEAKVTAKGMVSVNE